VATVAPTQLYQDLRRSGAAPLVAASFVAIAGRESSYNLNANSGCRPGTGDFFSTGLFQINLGAKWGPGCGGGSPDIHGSAMAQLLGTNDPLAALETEAGAIAGARQLYQQSGLGPWVGFNNIGSQALANAANASGGEVSLAQMLAIGGVRGGSVGSWGGTGPVTGVSGGNPAVSTSGTGSSSGSADGGTQPLSQADLTAFEALSPGGVAGAFVKPFGIPQALWDQLGQAGRGAVKGVASDVVNGIANIVKVIAAWIWSQTWRFAEGILGFWMIVGGVVIILVDSGAMQRAGQAAALAAIAA